MISHIVLYKVNPNNPGAAGEIVHKANLLKHVIEARGIRIHAARIPTSERAVGSNDFQVMLNCMFQSRWHYDYYMRDPAHLRFVRFVLRGWMIKGSTAEDPEAEFIDHILNAGPDSSPVEWARNPAIPEEEVVWAGEQVYDAIDDE